MRTVVSLFAGCGGSSCGYKAAGYDIRLAVEFDKVPAGIYAANFPATQLHVGDIRGLGNTDALAAAGLCPRELDVLDGSPPCQGFSTAGSRERTDPRNRLFEEYARMLDAFRPKAFVMENVPGMAKGKMRFVFAEVTARLRAAGYKVVCRQLNAWWYGVPQDRRRLIWVGLRGDLPGNPSHPAPTSVAPRTVAEALGSCLVRNGHGWFPGDKRADRPAGTLQTSPPRVLSERRGTAASSASSSWVKYYRDGEAPTLQSSQPPVISIMDGPKLAGSWSFPSNAARDARTADRPAGTLAAIRPPTAVAPGGETRQITVNEALILQGFPAWFKCDTYWPIGNAVPPPLAEAVARHVAVLLDAAGT